MPYRQSAWTFPAFATTVDVRSPASHPSTGENASAPRRRAPTFVRRSMTVQLGSHAWALIKAAARLVIFSIIGLIGLAWIISVYRDWSESLQRSERVRNTVRVRQICAALAVYHHIWHRYPLSRAADGGGAQWRVALLPYLLQDGASTHILHDDPSRIASDLMTKKDAMDWPSNVSPPWYVRQQGADVGNGTTVYGVIGGRYNGPATGMPSEFADKVAAGIAPLVIDTGEVTASWRTAGDYSSESVLELLRLSQRFVPPNEVRKTIIVGWADDSADHITVREADLFHLAPVGPENAFRDDGQDVN